MKNSKNISELIENYLNDILHDKKQIEIQRSELARLFNCVPSQINYVINTRFTLLQGYQVESKRGGGGYIRILKLDKKSHAPFFNELKRQIKNETSEKESQLFVERIYQEKWISKQEKILMTVALSHRTLGSFEKEEEIRSALLKNFLERLNFESREGEK